jgi:alpha-L-arabinofuranosidase
MPHLGAQALPVKVDQSDSLPDGSSAVTATASVGTHGTSLTIINRHYSDDAVVRFKLTGKNATAQIMLADAANAFNSAAQPERVRAVDWPVETDGVDGWCIEMPAHSMATVTIA